MSEELSRVKSRRRSKPDTAQREAGAPAVKMSASEGTEGVSHRTQVTLSRKDRHSGTGGKRMTKGTEEGADTPSRTKIHRMERVRLSKIFVNTLIVMFVALLASLFWWGWKGAPALDTLW
ncbi:hypothetical protein [Paenibacillus tepidiphilus]|uniref:hypothetical protein n=1 Tax=Paenibacillus tepidiphilus TaxID=2608683 RepID=UPI00123AD06B|nr:hypothetical protein [Paenibacillus tepidiphilus]